MKRLVVIAHDPSPNTKAMLQAVLEGAANEAVDGLAAGLEAGIF